MLLKKYGRLEVIAIWRVVLISARKNIILIFPFIAKTHLQHHSRGKVFAWNAEQN